MTVTVLETKEKFFDLILARFAISLFGVLLGYFWSLLEWRFFQVGNSSLGFMLGCYIRSSLHVRGGEIS